MHVEEYEARKGIIKNMEKYYEKWKLPSKDYRRKLCNCIPSDDEDNDVEQGTSESRTDVITNIMPTDAEDAVPSTSAIREKNTEYSDELDLKQVLDDTMETEKGQSENSER